MTIASYPRKILDAGYSMLDPGPGRPRSADEESTMLGVELDISRTLGTP
jgi:hypothetical protein